MSRDAQEIIPVLAAPDPITTPARPAAAPPAAKEFPLLDLLRFVAAVLVMLNHLRVNQFLPYSEVHGASDAVRQMFFCATRVGLESVVLFFVLSGFLVGGMSVDRFLRGKFDGGKYFIDRFARIYTPFVPALLLTIGVCLWLGNSFSWREAALNLASLQGAFAEPFSGNTSLWSLSYEVWFYILCGALLTLFGRTGGGAKWISLALLVASAVVFARLGTAYLFAWLLGLGAFFLKAPRPWILWAAGLVITAAGLVLMQLTSVSKQVDLASFKSLDRSVAILTLAAGLALLVAAFAQVRSGSPWMERVNRIGGALAAFSYTLYLMHIPVIIVLKRFGLLVKFDRLGLFTVGVFLGNAALTLAISCGVYLLFERHTPRVRQFLYRQVLAPR